MIVKKDTDPAAKLVTLVTGKDKVNSDGLKKDFERYLEVSNNTTGKRSVIKMAMNYLLASLGNIDVNSLTAKDVTALKKTLNKDKTVKYSKKRTISGELFCLVRWLDTGHWRSNNYTPRESVPSEKISLKIGRVHIDNLSEFMPLFGGGRFGGIRMEIRQEIMETPEDQFAFITGTKEMASNRKEREALRLAILKMLKEMNAEWVCRWSNMKNGFILARREHWDAIKHGKGA